MDAVTVSVGLLHDVVEDTLTTLEKIEELFGPEVAHIVDGVTKISQILFTSKEEKQAENFRKMLLAMTDDIRVIMVKFADRLHNMRTLAYLTADRREAIARETLEIDRKSTRLNSSHLVISYAVFCLKKKKNQE